MNSLFFVSAIERGWAWNIIRSLFAWLDSVAYTLFSWVMQLIFDIVSVSSDPAFNSFYDGIHTRIYALLAIFMLFKITISMLTYLVNPDSINDKERGMGKMVTRVVVSLVMLIMFPFAFQFLNEVQPHILEAIPRVILGTSSITVDESTGQVESGNLGSQMSLTGEKIAFETYNGVWFNSNCGDKDPCFKWGNTVDIAIEHINDASGTDSSAYQYDYFPLLGFVTAIIMTIILLGYCIDIAIRTFKLIILQIIAPIPIISYIDPKSSKDGAFSKWLKMVGSVYLDLFIKLAVIYFVILVISELITSGVVVEVAFRLLGEKGTARAGMVLIALIIGLLFFAKEAPKFIADALGIKMNENGKLFGGLGKIMAAGALGAGMIGSGIASGRASYMSDETNNKNHNAGRLLKNVGAGLVGGVSGFKTGLGAVTSAKDHHAKAAMDAMAKRNSTALAAGAAGSTVFGRALSTGLGLFAGETLASGGERKIKALEDFDKALGAIGSRAKDEMVKQNWTQGNIGAKIKDEYGNVIDGASTNYKSFMAAKNAAEARGAKSFNFTAMKDGKEFSATISMEQANMQEGFILKNNEDDYIVRATNDILDSDGKVIFEADQVLNSRIADAEAKAVGVSNEKITEKYYKNGKFKVNGRSSVKSTQDAINIDITAEQRKNATNKANDRFSGSGK